MSGLITEIKKEAKLAARNYQENPYSNTYQSQRPANQQTPLRNSKRFNSVTPEPERAIKSPFAESDLDKQNYRPFKKVESKLFLYPNK